MKTIPNFKGQIYIYIYIEKQTNCKTHTHFNYTLSPSSKIFFRKRKNSLVLNDALKKKKKKLINMHHLSNLIQLEDKHHYKGKFEGDQNDVCSKIPPIHR